MKLMDRGADPNKRHTYSLLYETVEYGNIDMCELLIDHGINIEDYTEDGTPLYRAMCTRREDIELIIMMRSI